MRGGTTANALKGEPDEGLSPLARGNLVAAAGAASVLGSIPACAGEPPKTRRQKHGPRVYPRLRGGTARHGQRRSFLWGLSPLARGNRELQALELFDQGSIPACAGEPQRPARRCGPRRVYPRLRGGTSASRPHQRPFSGLSPLARGNRSRSRPTCHWIRSIPACAGEPNGSRLIQTPQGVYPRLRGGTWSSIFWIVCLSGLSPLARGNLAGFAHFESPLGSIPACAGEPPLRRGCGCRRGSIPACAGEPSG